MPKKNSGWAAEYDARLDDPNVKKDVMKGGWRGRETRVEDDNGVMRRRNGAVCCGCGHGTHDNAHDTSRVDLDRADYTPRSHHDGKEDDGPKLFLGLF
jgi:hypothetical protein